MEAAARILVLSVRAGSVQVGLRIFDYEGLTAEATAAEGTRGGKFVFDGNTDTYSLMDVVPADSSVQTTALQY